MMTNYNERIDEIIAQASAGIGGFGKLDNGKFYKGISEIDAKQAITSLIKELVEEAKPGVPEDYERDDALYIGFERGREYYYDAISNILKELE